MTNILLKPFSDNERADFIIKNNHNSGLRIVETNTALYALNDYEKIQDDEIVLNPDYEAEKINQKNSEFKANFIELSYGCLRKKPKGYTSITEAMNSAFNIVSVMHKLPENILTFYLKPDFSQVEDIEEYLEANLFKNQEMTEEEFKLLYVEFQTIWNQQEHL